MNSLLLFSSRIILFTAIFAGATGTVFSQSIIHQNPQRLEENKKFQIQYSFSGFIAEDVLETGVYYKTNGQLVYNRILGTAANGRLSAIIPAIRQRDGSLSYYIFAELTDGRIITLPALNPEENPFNAIITETASAQSAEGTLNGLRYRIMSPLPGGKMVEDDAMIAISLTPGDDLPDPSHFRLLVNGIDVTAKSTITSYMIIYIPEGGSMPVGNISVALQKVEDEHPFNIIEWSAEIVSLASRYARAQAGENLTNGEVRLTGRGQQTGNANYDFARGTVNLYGNQGKFRYNISGLMTSQENSRLQAQNTYQANLSYGDIFQLNLGYVNPTLSPFLISGRRMHGVDTRLTLLKKGMSIQLIYGELSRSVPILYDNILFQTETYEIGGTQVTDTTFALNLSPGGIGTHKRNVVGGRLSFGSGRFFNWGINAIKAKDDVNSISVIRKFEDGDLTNYYGSLSSQNRAFLEQNPSYFSAQPGNPTPKDNFVIGSDLLVNAHNNRVQLKSDLAMSLLNTDITDGTFTRQRAEDLGFDLDNNVIDLLESIAWLFVINENMSSLPIKINDGQTEQFFPMGIVATQHKLDLNYFGNNFSFQYRWIGPDFTSLANNGIRRDIAGYSINDRFRLLNNTVYVSLSYDYLWDNLNNQLDSRTNTQSFGINTSWYPVSRDLPRITLGVRRQIRSNDVERENPFVSAAQLHSAVRNIRVVSLVPDTVVTTLANPRENATWQFTSILSKSFDWMNASHEATINYSRISTLDEKFDFGDFKTNLYTLGLSSSLANIPLRTNLSLNYTKSEAQSRLNDFIITGLNIGGSYFMLSNSLSVNADLSILSSRSEIIDLIVDDNGTPDNFFDDFYTPNFSSVTKSQTTSFILSGGSTYRFLRNHQLNLSLSVSNISNRIGPTSIPNDRFIQLRYIYNF